MLFFYFWQFFSKLFSSSPFLCLWHTFSPSGYPIKSIFQCQHIYMRCFWWIIFPLNYQNAYGHQTFHHDDMWQGVLTDKCAWHLNGVVLLEHMTNKIQISTCRRCIVSTIRQGADTEFETPKHDPLIKWPTWGHVTVSKSSFSCGF